MNRQENVTDPGPKSACRVSVLTPVGRAAIATVRITGLDAMARVYQRFAAADHRTQMPVGAIAFGHWQDGTAEMPIGEGEGVIVARPAADEIEVHCHGGQAAVDAIVQSLLTIGCQIEDWRASEQARCSPIAYEASEALVKCQTEKAARLVLWQRQGALEAALRRGIDLIEANRQADAMDLLNELSGTARAGLHLTQPFRVVFTGPPNVGKSSLVNAIVGYNRSIVCDEPGTTRDALATLTAINGWPVQLIDTAGLRDEATGVEQAGIARAVAAARSADLVVEVRDAADAQTRPVSSLFTAWRPPTNRDESSELPPTLPTLWVLNKSDLLPAAPAIASTDAARTRSGAKPMSAMSATMPEDSALYVSAKTGKGLEQLLASIAQRLVPVVLAEGQPVVFTPRQAAAVDQAFLHLERGSPLAAGTCLRKLVDSI